MKLFINIVMKRIYLFNTVAWNYERKKDFRFAKKKISQAFKRTGNAEKRSCQSYSASHIEWRAERSFPRDPTFILPASNISFAFDSYGNKYDVREKINFL